MHGAKKLGIWEAHSREILICGGKFWNLGRNFAFLYIKTQFKLRKIGLASREINIFSSCGYMYSVGLQGNSRTTSKKQHYYMYFCVGRCQGFFSKFLMGGGLKIFGPRRSPTGTKSDGGGGLAKKIRLKPKMPT